MTDTDWLALADFLDAHANDMRAWTEDEPKFRATAEGLRQYAAITAERDAAAARAAQLGTGIDSVRSHWHADEGPRWTANVIEALRHSGLMDDVMLSGTPDPDTDPNTLADRLDFMAQHPVGGYRNWNADLRAAADGLRQYAAITADDGRPLADHERSRWTAGEVRQMIQHAEELEAQLAAITAAVDLVLSRHGANGCENFVPPSTCRTDSGRERQTGSSATQWCDACIIADAASLSPTPTPDRCPTCDSSEDPERTMGGHWTCYDPWHDSGQP